jgi:hypothetical protein
MKRRNGSSGAPNILFPTRQRPMQSDYQLSGWVQMLYRGLVAKLITG